MPDTPARFIRALLAASLAATLGACAATGSKEGEAKSAAAATPAYQPVSDVPIPSGTAIKPERSLILGSGDSWLGRMVLDLKLNSTQAFTFYQEQMGAYGWQEVTAVQGKNSILTYVRGERAATLEITPGSMSGSTVSVTVSPRKPAAPPPAK